MRRKSHRAMYALLRRLEVAVLRLEDVPHERLRIAVDQWKPRALHLHHDLVPLAKAVMAPVQVDRVLVDLPHRDRLGLLEALAETGTHRLAADEELVAAHRRVLLVVLRIDVDKTNDEVAVGTARRREYFGGQRSG